MSESEPKIPEFRLTTDVDNRNRVIENMATAAGDLSLKTEWDVFFVAADESRRTLQNKLMWRWHKQWDYFKHEKPGHAHGETKLDLLLPIKLGCDHPKTVKRAQFELAVLDHVPQREIKIGVAYDLIRSRDIPVKLFAEYLNAYKDMAGGQGCILRSRKDLEDEALLRDFGRSISLKATGQMKLSPRSE